MKTQGKVWIIFDAEKKTQTKPMSIVQAQVVLLSIEEKEQSKFFLWTPGWTEWVSIRKFLQSDQRYFVLSHPPKPKKTYEKTRTQTSSVPDDTVTTTHNAPATSSDSPYTQVVVGETPLKANTSDEYWVKDFNGDELDLSKIKKIKPEENKKSKPLLEPSNSELDGAERRRDTRHNFKIEVVLVSKIRSFRTYSKNISLSGTLLEHEIPRDYLNKPFDLIIVNPFEPDPSKARLLFRAKIIGDMKDPRRLMFVEQDVSMTLRLDALLKAYVAYQDRIRKTAG